MYEERALEIARMIEEKQQVYGDAYPKVAQCLAALYPQGVRPDQYQELSYLTRILEKLCRVSQRCSETRGLETESPFKDIVGIAFLAMLKDEEKQTPN